MKKINLNNKVSDTIIKENLECSTLTCRQISDITGLSMYMCKNLYKNVKVSFSDFPYTEKASVRTDHFVKFYDSVRFYKLYQELYEVDLKN